jgi:hypothetical protein
MEFVGAGHRDLGLGSPGQVPGAWRRTAACTVSHNQPQAGSEWRRREWSMPRRIEY